MNRDPKARLSMYDRRILYDCHRLESSPAVQCSATQILTESYEDEEIHPSLWVVQGYVCETRMNVIVEVRTWLFEPAERSRRIGLVVAVDEHSARSEAFRDGESARQIMRENACCEPIFGGISTLQQRVDDSVTLKRWRGQEKPYWSIVQYSYSYTALVYCTCKQRTPDGTWRWS